MLFGKPYVAKFNDIYDIIKQRQSELQSAFEEIIWYTYRRNFQILETASKEINYVSDTGFGCMVRVG